MDDVLPEIGSPGEILLDDSGSDIDLRRAGLELHWSPLRGRAVRRRQAVQV